MFVANVGAAGSVEFVGRLDAAQAPNAMQTLQSLDGPIQLDLGKLDYISSAGLGVLIATHNRLHARGSKLVIVHPSEHVLHIFRLARLDQVFNID